MSTNTLGRQPCTTRYRATAIISRYITAYELWTTIFTIRLEVFENAKFSVFTKKDISKNTNSSVFAKTDFLPLQRIWLSAMGHCGGFGYTLRASLTDLVMRYGPLRGMKPYSKICIDILLCALGHSAGFGYPLWAVEKDLVKHYGQWRSIWFCAVGHSTKPISIAQN